MIPLIDKKNGGHVFHQAVKSYKISSTAYETKSLFSLVQCSCHQSKAYKNWNATSESFSHHNEKNTARFIVITMDKHRPHDSQKA